jgi:hypothetical protein
MTMSERGSALPLLHVPLRSVVNRPILAGAPAGKCDFPHIERFILGAVPLSGALVVLDFEGITVLSSSYFTAAFWPLWSQTFGIEIYPVLANLGPAIEEDARLSLLVLKTAAWVTSWSAGERSQYSKLGQLDSTLEKALEAVQDARSATAADLLKYDSSIGMTAWSNRLSALFQQRLVRREKDGRRLIYSPSWVE